MNLHQNDYYLNYILTLNIQINRVFLTLYFVFWVDQTKYFLKNMIFQLKNILWFELFSMRVLSGDFMSHNSKVDIHLTL